MIAHLSGTIAHKTTSQAVIDVGGVGYLVTATGRTLDAIGETGGAVKLLTEMIVREDSMTLFGFSSAHEKETFLLLQTVQGVGAKAAIAILTALSPHDVEEAIMAGDKAMITRADGIGPKIATRIVNELGEKLGKLKSMAVAPSSGSANAAGAENKMQQAAVSDALSALINLGYARAEAWSVLRDLSQADGGLDSAALIGAALKELGNKER
ncbi:MAG: Holliday junction branch migration protein RuvA [Candidatus Puniceispirillaceae bacterium]